MFNFSDFLTPRRRTVRILRHTTDAVCTLLLLYIDREPTFNTSVFRDKRERLMGRLFIVSVELQKSFFLSVISI